MMVQNKTPRKAQPAESAETGSTRPKPKPAITPFLAPKHVAARGPSDAILSSSPAFSTPAFPLKPFNVSTASILPIILPPATLRPLAFRTFTKKHGLTLTSSSLQELATFIGRNCGSAWREEGLAEKVLEEAAKSWKNCNGGVIVEGNSNELKAILKTLEGNMVGGKIMNSGRGLSRQNSLLLEPAQDAELANTRLGLRPTTMLTRDDSQASMGVSGLSVAEETDAPDDEGIRDVRAWLKVVDAFEQPRLVYNGSKKHFERDTTKPSLFPPAQHKTTAYRNRFNVIHQRLMRNELFQSSAVSAARAAPSTRRASLLTQETHKLTQISNLLGRHGSHHMLLGMLLILPTGDLAISDLTATIALDVQQAIAVPEDSSWFAPGMMVLVDGVYEEEEESAGKGLSGSGGVGGTIGGRFQAFFMGQPPCEKRKVTLGVSGLDGGPDHTVGGGFGWIDFLGVGSARALGSRMRKVEQRVLGQSATAEPGGPHRGRIVMIGEIHLNQPRSLQALKKILGLYAAEPLGSTPMTFVFAGNFAEHAVLARGERGNCMDYKEYFNGLATTLADFPTLLTSATFVFLPGDNDGWDSAFGGGAAVPLPRKPIPDMFASRLQRVFTKANSEAGISESEGGGKTVWTSNPSRLTLFGPNHELVLFRDDMSARLQRNAIRLKTSESTGAEDDAEDVAMSGAIPSQEPLGGENATDGAMDVDEQCRPERPSGGDQVPYELHTARKLVKTVLDQGYLAPFRQQIRPVHWDFAGALHLYPLPTALVLVDPGASPFCVTYEGCHVMNPSTLLVAGRKGAARWLEYEVGGLGKLRECVF